jgi:hypothetical protein
MKKKSLLVALSLVLFFIVQNSTAQKTEYSSLLISQELKENANAVIRNDQTEVVVNSINQLTVKRNRVVTVLNKLGKDEINAYQHYNNDSRVSSISAVVYDAFGNKIKKYSKSKFLDVSAVDGGTLYSDSRVLYLRYTPTSYPYTVVFESEYKTSSTGFIKGWFPVNGYLVSVEKSSYKLINKTGIAFRKKESNFKGFAIENTSTETELNYELSNQKAKKYERATISYLKFLPKLQVALNEFTLKGVRGAASNWKEFGKWMNDYLLNGRGELNEATVTKVKGLVIGVDDPIERAKIVYQYMQDKTRYISVQVGIGGWEPIAANKVDDVGYGDCKGLTNYTKALMDAADVETYYTVVYADDKRNIDKNFTSIQGNHIILNIPNKGKNLWLECTSQIMPFGFLGDFTDDRDVLVITPEGGIIKRTPKYINDTNYQELTATVQLEVNGDVKSDVERKSYGIQYDDRFHIERKTKDELVKYYKSSVWDYNNNLEVQNVLLKNDKDSIVFAENLQVSIKNYASISDQSYLFRLNVFNKINSVPKRYRKRLRPLKIDRGFTDVDKVEIKLPIGYKLEVLPREIKVDNQFGTYELRVEKIDESTLMHHRKFALKEGIHPKEEYKLYRSFRKKVAKYDNMRIELTKN